MEYLFAGALAVVIIGSIVLTIYFGLLSGPGRESGPDEFHFLCEACNKEVVLDVEDIPSSSGEGSDEEAFIPTILSRVDCPECGASQTAVLMVQCPNPDCKKYYVSPVAEDPDAFIRMGKAPRFICPDCGTDKMMWEHKHKK